MACPVTSADVAAELGAGTPPDARLDDSTESACALVAEELDLVADAAGEPVWPSPCPEPIRRAIIGAAVDLYRLPSTAFGYFVNDVGIASTGTDVMRRWRSLLDPYRVGWGLA